ncbi:hypothetical protein N8198_10030 [Gammaproteobacteria bacterium]|nr:hypothetical protein [Gammaproteobacteria bacterium]
MSVLKFAITPYILMFSTVLFAANRNQQTNYENDYYLLQHYQLIYTREIFDFCVDRHGTSGHNMRSCMIHNDKLKKDILSDALDQLGRNSLAQRVYDDCVDYYPTNGVARISECVETRLDLADTLKDHAIEKVVYQKCDDKWRKHGFKAIDACSRSEARYYRKNGSLRD